MLAPYDSKEMSLSEICEAWHFYANAIQVCV